MIRNYLRYLFFHYWMLSASQMWILAIWPVLNIYGTRMGFTHEFKMIKEVSNHNHIPGKLKLLQMFQSDAKFCTLCLFFKCLRKKHPVLVKCKKLQTSLFAKIKQWDPVWVASAGINKYQIKTEAQYCKQQLSLHRNIHLSTLDFPFLSSLWYEASHAVSSLLVPRSRISVPMRENETVHSRCHLGAIDVQIVTL